jgi:hypothetical protein
MCESSDTLEKLATLGSESRDQLLLREAMKTK